MLNLLLLVLVVSFLGVDGKLALGRPQTIVNGRSLRVHLENRLSKNDTRHHYDSKSLTIARIVACSSIDMPFYAYNQSEANTTGCNSPGFQSEVIFPSSTSLFKVRRRGDMLYMKRRLVVWQSPLVYLQMHVRRFSSISNEKEEEVDVTQYRVPERVLSLSASLSSSHAGNGEVGKNEETESSLTSDDAQEERVIVPPGQLKWYEYTATIMMFVGMMVALFALAWCRAKKKVKKFSRLHGGGTYTESRDRSNTETIKGWLSAAMDKGIYTQAAASTTTRN